LVCCTVIVESKVEFCRLSETLVELQQFRSVSWLVSKPSSYEYLNGYVFFFFICKWFSWNIGPAHIISISTEVYFFYQYGIEQIVQQYDWLEKDLQVRKRARSN